MKKPVTLFILFTICITLACSVFSPQVQNPTGEENAPNEFREPIAASASNPTSTPAPALTPTIIPTPLPPLPPNRMVITKGNINGIKPLVKYNLKKGEYGSHVACAWSRFTGEFAISSVTYLGVHVFNPDTMQQTVYLDDIGMGIAFSPTQPLLAALSQSRVTIWDTVTGKEKYTLSGESLSGSIAFSPDGKVLATGTTGGLIELWDTSSGDKINEMKYSGYPGNPKGVLQLVFTPDGKYLISKIYKVIIFWDAATGELLNDKLGTSAMYSDIDLAKVGPYLGVVSENIISVWNISKGGQKIPVPYTELLEIDGGYLFTDSIEQIAFGHLTDLLFASSYNGEVGAWSLNPIEELFLQKEHTASVECLELSDDGRTLLSASTDGSVVLWGVTP